MNFLKKERFKFKSFSFVDNRGLKTASMLFDGSNSYYVGKVKSVEWGRGLCFYGANEYNYIPTRIVKEIIKYINKTIKRGKPIIYQDYNFYIFMYDNDCIIEVETEYVNHVQ